MKKTELKKEKIQQNKIQRELRKKVNKTKKLNDFKQMSKEKGIKTKQVKINNIVNIKRSKNNHEKKEIEYEPQLIIVVLYHAETKKRVSRKDLLYAGLEIKKTYLKKHKNDYLLNGYEFVKFCDKIIQCEKKDKFLFDIIKMLSKCDVNIFIHEKNKNLGNVNIKNTEIRKKGQNAINNKFINENNNLYYDEINKPYHITTD